MAFPWAKVDEETGDVNCPKCGRLCNGSSLFNYGVNDDDSFYFIRQCKKCGTKSVYLNTLKFEGRYAGEGVFSGPIV